MIGSKFKSVLMSNFEYGFDIMTSNLDFTLVNWFFEVVNKAKIIPVDNFLQNLQKFSSKFQVGNEFNS